VVGTISNRRGIVAATSISIVALLAWSSARTQVHENRDNLMAVLREAVAENKQDEALKPVGSKRYMLANGKEVEVDIAAFEFIGDVQIRFVYDGPTAMRTLMRPEFDALGLRPEQALQVAMANIKRTHGEPTVTQFPADAMLLTLNNSPDLASSYFLDRDFWRNLLKRHPEGLVVAVPERAALLFAPLSASTGVGFLRDRIAHLHAGSDLKRISSAVYLFKDDRWTVFQPAKEP
jgi:hypothetical protein